MAFEKKAMVMVAVVFFMASALQLTEGVVYKVGDSTGWTTMGNFDYKGWSSAKTFRVGDTILFEYNAQFHNVMQVNHTQYNACNASAPIVTHTTGKDAIKITRTGHLYFICGVPGHCQAGQKVDIRVPMLTADSPAMSPTAGGPVMSPSGSTSTTSDSMSPMSPMSPGPSQSPKNAASAVGGSAFVAFAVAVFVGFLAY